MVDVLEAISNPQVEQLQPGWKFYVREYGWCEVASIVVPPFGPDYMPVEPCTVTLAQPVGPNSDITEFRFPPSATVLASYPTAMPDPAQTFHTVYKDAGTGEFVTEEYALAHPDTTFATQVPD